MGRRCRPGMICVEYVTLSIFMFLIGIIIYLMYPRLVNKMGDNNYGFGQGQEINSGSGLGMVNVVPTGNFGISSRMGLSRDVRDMRQDRDVLGDPYEPPLKTNLGVPVNVRTQGRVGNYQQTGILTKKSNTGDSTILPLMGRELNASRDKWNFYTMNDKNNMIKLPVSHRQKSCTGEYGCDNLSNGDNVYVEGYNDTFNVTMYENNSFQYIPYL